MTQPEEAQTGIVPVGCLVDDGEITSLLREGSRRLVLLWISSLGVRSPRGYVLGPALFVGTPLLANATGYTLNASWGLRTATAWGLLTALAAFQLMVLVAAAYLWSRLENGMPTILGVVPYIERLRLLRWFEGWYRPPRQLLLGACFAALALGELKLASPALHRHLEISPLSYLSVCLAGFLGGVALYSLLLLTRFVFVLEALRPLALDLWQPAQTPALRSLSEGYLLGLTAMVLAVGSVELIAARVPSHAESVALQVVISCLPIAGVTCGLIVGVLPHYAIARMIAEGKAVTIAKVDAAIQGLDDGLGGNLEQLRRLVDLREKVASSPTLPFKAPWLAPLVAALIGPLIAFLLTRHGHVG